MFIYLIIVFFFGNRRTLRLWRGHSNILKYRILRLGWHLQKIYRYLWFLAIMKNYEKTQKKQSIKYLFGTWLSFLATFGDTGWSSVRLLVSSFTMRATDSKVKRALFVARRTDFFFQKTPLWFQKLNFPPIFLKYLTVNVTLLHIIFIKMTENIYKRTLKCPI